MGARDPRIDAYIRKSPPFAQPILTRIREVVHETVPEAGEDLKWGHPSFIYKGILCGMASFKKHAMLHFWDSGRVFPKDGADADVADRMARIADLSELPTKKALTAYLRRAVALRDAGVREARKPRRPAKPLRVPPALAAALKKNRKAQAAFDAFSTSHRNEYAEWVGGAKSAKTRERRVATAIEWIAEGKGRHWKYEKKVENQRVGDLVNR